MTAGEKPAEKAGPYTIKDVFALCAVSNFSFFQYDHKDALLCNYRDYIKRLLSREELRGGLGHRWELSWGPCIYTGTDEKRGVADNALYAAVNEQRSVVVISIAGTNPISLYSWLKQDFLVEETAVWPFCAAEEKEQVRVSLGTLRGFTQVLNAEDEGETLKAYLNRLQGNERSLKHVVVTGHSLGAPLALCTGVWLDETRGQWQTRGGTDLSVYTFAGATAGNGHFVNYVEDRLRHKRFSYYRYWNRYDIVPYVWNEETIQSLPRLYEPEIAGTPPLRAARDWALSKAAGKDYRHVYANTPPLQPAASPDQPESRTELASSSPSEKNPVSRGIKKIKDKLTAVLTSRKNVVGSTVNTYQFAARCVREHIQAYFSLLDMDDIWEIMIHEEVFRRFYSELRGNAANRIESALKQIMPQAVKKGMGPLGGIRSFFQRRPKDSPANR